MEYASTQKMAELVIWMSLASLARIRLGQPVGRAQLTFHKFYPWFCCNIPVYNLFLHSSFPISHKIPSINPEKRNPNYPVFANNHTKAAKLTSLCHVIKCKIDINFQLSWILSLGYYFSYIYKLMKKLALSWISQSFKSLCYNIHCGTTFSQSECWMTDSSRQLAHWLSQSGALPRTRQIRPFTHKDCACI